MDSMLCTDFSYGITFEFNHFKILSRSDETNYSFSLHIIKTSMPYKSQTVGIVCMQVHVLADNLDIDNVNSVNLRAALSAALLLLPANFTQVCFHGLLRNFRAAKYCD